MNKKLWEAEENVKLNSHMHHYMDWLENEKELEFAGYQDLWEWSVNNVALFWESIWQYFDIHANNRYHQVLSGNEMPDYDWFSGAELNYSEHLMRNKDPESVAIIFRNELNARRELTWKEVKDQVISVRKFLMESGVKKGDRVVAYLPNIPEANIAFLAVNSLGAIWSSCSPDFGVNSVIDRFKQIEPKVLITVDGYSYNGKTYKKIKASEDINKQLPSVTTSIMINYIGEDIPKTYHNWQDIIKPTGEDEIQFTPVSFDHPIWVLYSSGTTGVPKAITHSHGGVLLEHYKYMSLHNDVKKGEKYFWFTTTGWMMWNYLQAAWLCDASIVLYDGSPGYPDLGRLWSMAEEVGIHHFGTSAPFLVACMKNELRLDNYGLEDLRSIGSTGAPLPPDAFNYVYHCLPDVWLCSMAGGTDVCTAFIGSNPLLPVFQGEIQCRALGCELYAFSEQGKPVIEELGEMVLTSPLPSMPIYFWGDEEMRRYKESYFNMYPGIWRHGDFIKITENGGIVIYGRSDATLNKQGVRIGTSEIYRTMNLLPEIEDSLIVNLELDKGQDFMPLFVKMKEGAILNNTLKNNIKSALRKENSPRHVPDAIIEVADIPYTISGKKLETPVKKILLGMDIHQAANRESLRNPQALDYFANQRKEIIDEQY